ncbi:MAG TPA: carboxypeptidase-like regulatory domain-containing protein [Jatrophihabitans sp.]|nr:carboxypeptidase-like regulatory domain-containing protein [Jatrophihabitans sp.]
MKRLLLPALALLISAGGVSVLSTTPAGAAAPSSALSPSPTAATASQSAGAVQPLTGTQPSATAEPTSTTGPASTGPDIAQPAAGAKPAAADTTPPGPVAGLGMTGNTISSVTLGWADPTDADLAHIVIRRAAGSTAPAADQGTLVATLGATKISYTDKDLASATAYSYALFAEDKSGNLSSAAAVTAYTAATDAHTGLSGTLTDSAGKGIGNVLVHVRLGSGDAADTITSSTGAYSVTNLMPGTYYVCYEPKANVGGPSVSGYLPGCYHQQSYYGGTPVTVTAGALTSKVNDTLAPAAAITGRITGPDGLPIAGVVVTTTIYSPSYAYLTSTTSTDGVYLFKNLAPNQYYNFCYDTSKAVGSSPDGYLGGCYSNYTNPAAGQLTTYNVTLNVGGVITGVVRDHNGNPVSGAKVFNGSYGGNPAVTDTNGGYRLAKLPAGTYSLCVDGSAAPVTATGPYGYFNECGHVNVPVTVQLNQVVSQDLTVDQNGALDGVLSESDGSPAAHTQIDFYSANGYGAGYGLTDADGHWQMNEPAGQYYVCYLPDDPIDVWTCHSAATFNGSQPTGDQVTVAEGVLTPVNDTLLAGGVVSGTVTGPDGAPLANALVQVDSSNYEDHQALTDSSGHYSVTGLPAGQYVDCASVNQDQHQPGSPGYTDQCYGRTAADPYPFALTISPGQRFTIDLQIGVATEIEGRVTDSAGDPVSGVTVYITNEAGASGGQLGTDGNGEFDFWALTPGDYTVCYDASYAYPAPATGYLNGCWQNQPADGTADPVHAVAGLASTVNPVLAGAGGVAGTVTDSSGNPVGGIPVTVVGSDGTALGGIYTDWDGNYQVTGLPVTAVAVCVDGSWYGYQSVCYANAPDYRSATTVTLAAGSLVSGIDIQVTASASPQVGVNRPDLAQRVSRTA